MSSDAAAVVSPAAVVASWIHPRHDIYVSRIKNYIGYLRCWRPLWRAGRGKVAIS